MLPASSPTPPAAVPVARMRVITERRRRPFIAGLACCIAGLGITLGGAALAFATQALEVATAEGRAAVGSPISFQADDETYGIILLPEATGVSPDQIPVQNLQCSVMHPDGAAQEVDTASSGSRLETSAGREAGSFEGRAGATTVTCAWRDGHTSPGDFYSVATLSETAHLIGNILLIGGVVVIGVGVVLLVIGIRGRSVRVPIQA